MLDPGRLEFRNLQYCLARPDRCAVIRILDFQSPGDLAEYVNNLSTRCIKFG